MQNIRSLLVKLLLPLIGIAAIAGGGLYFVAPDKFQQILPIGTTPAKIFTHLKPASSTEFTYEAPVLKNVLKIKGTIFNDPTKYSKVNIELNLGDILKNASTTQKLPVDIKRLNMEVLANAKTAYIKLYLASRSTLQAEIQKNIQVPPTLLTTYLDPAISVLSGEKYLKVDKSELQKYSKKNINYTQAMLSPQAYMDLIKLVYKSLDIKGPTKVSLDGQKVYKMRIHLVKDKILNALNEAKKNDKLLKELQLTQTQLDQLIAKVQSTKAEDIESLYLDMYFKPEGNSYYIAAISPSLKLNEKQKESLQKTINKLENDTSVQAQELKAYLTKAQETGMLSLGIIKYTNINKVTTTITPPTPEQTTTLDQFMTSVFYYLMMSKTRQQSNTSNPLEKPSIIAPTPTPIKTW